MNAAAARCGGVKGDGEGGLHAGGQGTEQMGGLLGPGGPASRSDKCHRGMSTCTKIVCWHVIDAKILEPATFTSLVGLGSWRLIQVWLLLF